MRPCPHCGEAVGLREEVCPQCGKTISSKTWSGPPPETGPGISGDPENRWAMIGLVTFPAVFSIVTAIIVGVGAFSLWGPAGILVGLLAGIVSFMAIMLMETL